MAEAIRQRLPETTPAYPKANRPEAGVFITGHRPPLIGGQESPRQSIRGKKLTTVYEAERHHELPALFPEDQRHLYPAGHWHT